MISIRPDGALIQRVRCRDRGVGRIRGATFWRDGDPRDLAGCWNPRSEDVALLAGDEDRVRRVVAMSIELLNLAPSKLQWLGSRSAPRSRALEAGCAGRQGAGPS